MTITKTSEGSLLTLALEGRLDTNTTPALESELKTVLEGVERLVFDMGKLNYISSAGLRVLLMAQKTMNTKKGTMIIRGCSSDIMDIFDVTGFIDILTIEN